MAEVYDESPGTVETPVTPRFRALHKAIENSYKSVDWARNLNRNLVMDYHGPAYGANSNLLEHPINKVNQAIDIWTMLVAANRPKVSITTNFDLLRPFARHYEQAVNNLITEIHIEDTIRRWVLDAFFMVGIVKVHLKDSALVEMETDLWMDPGSPFASNVSLDDFVYDASAKKWSEVKYAGDMYRIPFADIAAGVEQGMYDADVAAELTPNSKVKHTDDARLEAISRGIETDEDEFEPMIDLCDIWVARDRKVYTFAVKDRTNFILANTNPLAEMDWTEPDHGPYHLLGFSDVPENILPLSPIQHIQSLNKTINSLARKQAHQAERQKENPIYNPAGKDTIKALVDAPDGFAVKGDPKEVGLWTQGGAHQGNQALMLLFMEVLDGLAGNLQALGGLGPQAKTVGQEQIVADSSNRKVAAMQGRVITAAAQLCQSLGYMLWEDQWKEVTSMMQVEGTNYELPVTWKPGDREGNFQQYNFAVDVLSMQSRPPAQIAETILGLMERLIVPLAPMMMQTGALIDFPALITELSQLYDIEQLKRIITFATPPEPDTLKPQDKLSGGRAPTHNIRENVSTGGTQESRLAVMRQALQGQSPNAQQMGAISTPMGGGQAV